MVLRIALQKSGRLAEPSVEILRRCGISFSNGAGKLRTRAENFPLEIYFIRDDDIPEYVNDGIADAGIVGENIIEESGLGLEVVEKLGFGRCRLSLAVPKAAEYDGIEWFNGKKIATSYPKTLTEFFKKNNVEAELHSISGSVEIAPSIGLADGICDLVSSGSTLLVNGLREVCTVMDSQAVLVTRKTISNEARDILESLVFRLKSVIAARQYKYILLNCPQSKVEAVSEILPGMKSPTIMPLAEKGWVSIHSVIKEDDFWSVIGKLKEAGAEGILVLSIDQMIR